MESINIGIRRTLKPHVFQQQDDIDGIKSKIDAYTDKSIEELFRAREDGIDDNGMPDE